MSGPTRGPGPLARPGGPEVRAAGSLVQRKCACGASAGASLSGACPECEQKKLQKRTLDVSEPGDRFEREAERSADAVLAGRKAEAQASTPGASVQRESNQALADADVEHAAALVSAVLDAPGEALDAATQQRMARQFGHDFSRVRIHSDAKAAESARDLRAAAYTVGADIVFAAGHFSATTEQGQHLLAHELTHVVQQSAAPASARAAPAEPAAPALLRRDEDRDTPPDTAPPTD